MNMTADSLVTAGFSELDPRCMMRIRSLDKALPDRPKVRRPAGRSVSMQPAVRLAHYVECLALALPSREESAIALFEAIWGSS
jgi:hypothetical protein